MYHQNQLLRQYALGNFTRLLVAIAHDPAMMVYLDTVNNHRGHANENFAREVMELFTLGEGHYSEKDIQEAARAFTGWEVDHKTGGYMFRPHQHDQDQKTFFGQTGNFDGDNILYLIMARPEVAEFIATKLWKEFISETPDPAEVKRLAGLFRDHNYEIRPLMQSLLLSPAFWDPANAGVLTKSPVDLMVGAVRTFQRPMQDTMPLVVAGRAMGQDIFDPPNVKGWPGGERWISTYSLLLRRQFLDRLLRGKEMEYEPPKMQALMGAQSAPPDAQDIFAAFRDVQGLDQVTAVLLPVPPVDPIPPQADLPRQVRSLVFDPAYELK
jgi:uncharacterized protein (DUF1800 family)